MEDTDATSYEGRCFCGAVRIRAKGAPFSMGYCHCEDCRAWAAAPVNAFTLWSAGSVEIAKGEEHVGTYCKTERSHRKHCVRCGGHLLTDHPGEGFTDVYAAILPELTFEPRIHVHYAERVLRIVDGLPKYEHLPQEFGGDGKEVPE